MTLSARDIALLRWSMQPHLADLPVEELDGVVHGAIANLSHANVENFLQGLGSIGKAVGPMVQRSAPAMAQGAATGASVGGPWGALIGAGVGLATSAAGGKGRTPPAGQASQASNVPPAATSLPVPGLPSGQGAAAALLGLSQNPAVLRGLLSQALGAAGKQQIPTPSGASVPPGAINNLLMQLLSNANEALPIAETADTPAHLVGGDGEYLVDPASPEQQAALLLSWLQRRAAPLLRDSARGSESWNDEAFEQLPLVDSEDWLSQVETVELY